MVESFAPPKAPAPAPT
ncbi:hypothetical protein D030_3540A, partial [Vibrio parahaemolyticus AQ3810]